MGKGNKAGRRPDIQVHIEFFAMEGSELARQAVLDRLYDFLADEPLQPLTITVQLMMERTSRSRAPDLFHVRMKILAMDNAPIALSTSAPSLFAALDATREPLRRALER